MKLNDLLKYDSIIIQCHNNPDPDAIASAFGLYSYFLSKDKTVEIIYSGTDLIQKSNISLMIKELNIPIEYYEYRLLSDNQLLITVDCQYGESNVGHIDAKNIAIIDHHNSNKKSKYDPLMTEIHPELGSCSTLVWKMLLNEDFDIKNNKELSTALYYGLLTDTSEFTELNYPLDKDMRDYLIFDRPLITRLNNSKISLSELEVAGVALIKYVYNPEYNYAIVHAKPCDPNILGYIIDLVLQVDVIDTCIVFNEKTNGYKFSVRSCIKDVHANELAAYIAKDIGGGGGHKDKAGGFISKTDYETIFPHTLIDDYINSSIKKYFNESEIIYTKDYEIDTTDMKLYQKKDIVIGFVDPLDFVDKNCEIIIRTLEGDISLFVTGDFYIMINILGEVYPIKKDRFAKDYKIVSDSYSLDTEYIPNFICKTTGETFNDITVKAKSCRASSFSQILAKPVDHITKIYTLWDNENYYLGNPGDYIVCKSSDPKDVYIIANKVFKLTYEEISN